jgi:hypothetical protein
MSKLMDDPGPTKAPKVFALFQNLETQGAPLSWAWAGQVYTYEDGQVYEMSQEQIAHLNSLTVMVHKQEVTQDGQVRTVPLSRRHRFSVREVGAGEVAKIKADLAAQAV